MATASTSELALLFPEVEVPVGTTVVKVRELAWPDALEFLKRLTALMGQMPTMRVSTSGELRLDVDSAKLAHYILECAPLADFLLSRATDLPEATRQRLPVTVFLRLLEAAIAQTLHADFFAQVARVVTATRHGLGAPVPAPAVATTTPT